MTIPKIVSKEDKTGSQRLTRFLSIASATVESRVTLKVFDCYIYDAQS